MRFPTTLKDFKEAEWCSKFEIDQDFLGYGGMYVAYIKAEYLDFSEYYYLAKLGKLGYTLDECNLPDIDIFCVCSWDSNDPRPANCPDRIFEFGEKNIRKHYNGSTSYEPVEFGTCWRCGECADDMKAEGKDPSKIYDGDYWVAGYSVATIKEALRGSLWKYIKKPKQ